MLIVRTHKFDESDFDPRGLSSVQPQESLGLAEYALLAQGRKIAARPLRTSNCSARPVAAWSPGLFLRFWDQRLVAE